MKEEHIGDCRLILGDCLEVMPTLGNVDAVVTDPPYGIGADKSAAKNGGKWGWKFHGGSDWDRARPPKAAFDAILTAGRHQIIWGGNYFTDYLPPTMHWIIWDKGQRDFSLADFEMAWGSQKRAARIFEFSRAKAIGDGKVHYTQKPVELMRFCIAELPASTKTILDPFMGSGTTLVACAKLGRAGIGIEIDPDYFRIACERVQKAYDQPDLFVEPPAKPEQVTLDLGGSE